MKYAKKISYLFSEAEQDDLIGQIVDDVPDSEEDNIDTEIDEKGSTNIEAEKPVEDVDEKEVSSFDNESQKKKKEMEQIDKYNKAVDNKLNIAANKIINSFMIYLNRQTKNVLNDLRTYGLQSTIKNYVESYYIPNLTDTDYQLFLSINLNELVDKMSDKLKTRYAKIET